MRTSNLSSTAKAIDCESSVVRPTLRYNTHPAKMASQTMQVEEVFEGDYQRVNPFSAESVKNAVRARRWDAKADRQITIANELSRLASDEYLEDIMQHARAMEVGRISPWIPP